MCFFSPAFRSHKIEQVPEKIVSFSGREVDEMSEDRDAEENYYNDLEQDNIGNQDYYPGEAGEGQEDKVAYDYDDFYDDKGYDNDYSMPKEFYPNSERVTFPAKPRKITPPMITKEKEEFQWRYHKDRRNPK